MLVYINLQAYIQAAV